MFITSASIPGSHASLTDTGAQFSAIALKLVKQHHIAIRPPLDNEPQYLSMADRTKVVKRIGSVMIPISIHFSGGAYRAPYICSKKFEILDMDYDFILGVDILPQLFPFDDVMNYLILPSRISSPPQSLSISIAAGDDSHEVCTSSASHFNGEVTMRYVSTHDGPVPPSMNHTTTVREYVDELASDYYIKLCTIDVDDLNQHLLTVTKSPMCSVASSSSGLNVHVDTQTHNRMVTTSFDDIYTDNENENNAPLSSTGDTESNDNQTDMPTLTDQVSDMGIGEAPPYEVPQKPTASTPLDKEHEYKPMRLKVLAQLSSLLKENEAISGFCTGDGSTVTLSVKPDDEQHVYSRQYPIAQSLESTVDELLQKWLKQGRIVLATRSCRFNSPLLVVKKKDEHGQMTGVRVCLDVRKLNKYLIENDRFQIPHIPDMLATLAGGCIFGEFDLSEAYFQFQLSQSSQQYTAFTWKKQQYMFVSCPYGIKHIPSLFQRFIANLFRDMPFVFTYIDNICFSSRSWKEHVEHAAAIIERLTSVNLRIKPSSVNLGNYQIKLLGHLITPFGIGLDPEKRDIILNWPKPSTGSELASFLGLGTFLRDHIRHYADITAPFEKMKKHTSIEWTESLSQQWDLVKRAFATAPFLKFPDFNKRFVIATDASQTGIGGVLYQPDDEGNTITANNIVAIVSKQLNESQRRYPVYKKELWAVVYCLRKFHTFIHGRRDVTVLTDHKPLIHILKQQSLCTALQQWLDVLLDYDLTIIYRPGVLHVIPDALSRMYMSSYADNVDTWGTHSNIRIIDAFTHVSLPSDFLCQQSLDAIKAPTATRKRHQFAPTQRSGGGKLTSTQAALLSLLHEDTSPFDSNAADMHEFINATSVGPLFACATELPPPQLCMASLNAAGVLTDEEKLLIAQEKRGKTVPAVDQRQQIVEAAHAAGHYGEKAMYAHIDNEGYWWPHMRDDIASEIRDCRDCQRYNIIHCGYHPARSITATLPGDHYQIDLASMPTSMEGHKFILVLVDVFTGFVMLKPIIDKEASTVARAVWEICCIIGVPKILQSDNGLEFSNRIINALCRLTGISRRFIAPYNPRADGKVERTVKTVKDTVVKLLHGAVALWPLYIPFVQLVFNNKVQELTGSSPFTLMFTRPLNQLIDYTTQPHAPISMDDWQQHQEKVVSLIFPSVSDRIKGKQESMRAKLDALRKKVTSDELLPGTVVMIKDPIYLLNPSLRPTREPTWIGPYTIVRRTLYGPYILRDDTGQVYARQVNIDQMKVLYSPSAIPSQRAVEDENTYEVDYIISHRERNGQYEYLIKWKGYDKKDATWENEDAFNDPQPVERYFKLLQIKKQAKNVRLNHLFTSDSDSLILSSLTTAHSQHQAATDRQ